MGRLFWEQEMMGLTPIFPIFLKNKMTVRSIINYPNDFLLQKTVNVEDFEDVELLFLIQDLKDTMFFNNAAGIAANQIGSNKRIFIVDGKLNNKKDPIIFINPKIIKVSEKTCTINEGCLSFPDAFLYIKRPKNLEIKYCDIDGNKYNIEANGFFARAILHEYDHLEGKLMIDYVNFFTKKRLNRKFRIK